MAQIGKVRLPPWLLALLSLGILLNEGLQLGMGLVCVLLHEAGHIAAARRFGASVEGVTLNPFGGAAHLMGLYDLSPWEETEVALAGPLVSVLLAALSGCMAHILPQFADFLDNLMFLNGSLALFNLLPVFPLDGSRILSRLSEGRSCERLMNRLQCVFGIVLGIAFALFGVLFGFAVGRVNVTWVLCGGYLFCENIRRKKEQPFARMRKTAAREGLLSRKRIVKVRQYAVEADVAENELLRHLPGGMLCRVAWLDDSGREISAKYL